MPQIARIGNNLYDRKCSKCKKMKEPHDYELRNMIYQTCNHCRFKAYQRNHPNNTIADFQRGSTVRIVDVSNYIDTDSNYSEQEIIQEYNTGLLAMSSSAAASTDNYFVREPEEEPEPENSNIF